MTLQHFSFSKTGKNPRGTLEECCVTPAKPTEHTGCLGHNGKAPALSATADECASVSSAFLEI